MLMLADASGSIMTLASELQPSSLMTVSLAVGFSASGLFESGLLSEQTFDSEVGFFSPLVKMPLTSASMCSVVFAMSHGHPIFQSFCQP